eukprot:TRINITY_DN1454_c0_g1_i1.p1 TRINITY_DN1454_c0_g1~~TRINITY_DN1454_c0_g1_i1.p1  ORF type:complete len:104 (+),score=20.59 TRINITY_DN1454_c0_g1_i1:45-356(+)
MLFLETNYQSDDGEAMTGHSDYEDVSDTALDDLYEASYEGGTPMAGYTSGPESPTATALEIPKRTIGYTSSGESHTEYEFQYSTHGKRTIGGTQSQCFFNICV